MKTTIEIPDDLFRRSKATAALQGQSLKEFVAEALHEHLDRPREGPAPVRGWRSVFGRARATEVESVDAILAEDLERIDLREWQ